MLELGTLFRLLPRGLDLVDLFQQEAMARAVADPGRRWSSSSAFLTFDRRVLDSEGVRDALERARERTAERLHARFERHRAILTRWTAGDVAAALEELGALADHYAECGQLADAARLARTAARLADGLDDAASEGRALGRLGRILYRSARLDEAALCLARSYRLAWRAGDAQAAAETLLVLGDLRTEQGRLDAAAHYYGRAGRRAPEVGDGVLAAQAYAGMGSVERARGNPIAALAWSGRALALLGRSDNANALAAILNDRGLTLTAMGEGERAETTFRRALFLAPDPGIRSLSHLFLGRCALSRDHLLKAEEEARAVETIALAHGFHQLLVHAYRLLGQVSAARGEESGLVFFEAALELARLHGDARAEADALFDYGRFRAACGEWDAARPCYERAMEHFHRLGLVERRIEVFPADTKTVRKGSMAAQ